MKPRLGIALVLAVGVVIASASAQISPDTDPVNIHLAAAQRAAGLDFPGLLARVCIVPPTGSDAAAGRRRAGGVNGLTPPAAAPRQEVAPPRSQWYQEPRQIFDNLYWVGNLRNNAWVIKTSAGLIVLDTLFHYTVEAEIVDARRRQPLRGQGRRAAVSNRARGMCRGGEGAADGGSGHSFHAVKRGGRDHE